ncbi:hypothetical protein [Puia dinghuensis]|uniref:hypothetical protein n=1 Tax=Puia dinghuensis TaxID=1792502 RepID=UPI003570DE90
MAAPGLSSSLPNGKVMIIGGSGDLRTSVEFFNPVTRKFETGEPAPFDLNGTALALPDGRILIAGGTQGHQPTRLAGKIQQHRRVRPEDEPVYPWTGAEFRAVQARQLHNYPEERRHPRVRR